MCRKPEWGWSADAVDGGGSGAGAGGSAGGFGNADLAPSLPPALRHFYVVSEPRHKVRMCFCVVLALSVCFHAVSHCARLGSGVSAKRGG